MTGIFYSMAIAAALAIGLYVFFRFTRHGQFMVAVADNADLAEVYGIDKGVYFAMSLAIAGILITAAMYVFGSKLALYPELTLHVMIFAVAATILGGIGNVFGAAWAAVAISVVQQLSILIVASRWQPLVVFLILFVAIVFFPRGIRLPRRVLGDGRSAMSSAPSAEATP